MRFTGFGIVAAQSAMVAPEGVGDVQTWPSLAEAEKVASTGRKTLNIELCSPDGYARFEASAAGFGSFLARSYELVPAGEESDCLNLDAGLTVLLSEA